MPPSAWPPLHASYLRRRHGGWGSAGFLAADLTLSLVTLLVLLPAPSRSIFLPQQNITATTPATFCGFYSIERYKAWCEGSILAFVASNSSCQQYGVCIPLDGDDAMTCGNSSSSSTYYCSGWRRGGTAAAACLVLRATAMTAAVASATLVLCDVEIEGRSVYDMRPPLPPGPAPPPPPADALRRRDDWALWKTMTIIWSILGFAALLVVAVLLIRWCMRRHALAASSSPVTILSAVDKSKIEQEAQQAADLQQQQQYSGASAGASVTLRPTAPDGKPILAYGSYYPPPPPPPLMLPSITANGSNRLPPSAGDALLQAAADSRAAHNGPPMRTTPVNIPPLAGAGMPPPPPRGSFPGAGAEAGAAAAAAVAAAAAATTAAAVAIAGAGVGPAAAAAAQPPYGSGAASGAEELPLVPLGPEPGPGEAAAAAPPPPPQVPVVTPAALVPPPAATLQKPAGPS